MDETACVIIPAPVHFVTVVSDEDGGVWLVAVVVVCVIVRSRREQNNEHAVGERRDDRDLGVDGAARNTEV
jgi:hypothetical protein